MAEYIDRNKIPWAKVDNPNGIFWERVVFESTINNIPPADVIERSKIDKTIKKIEQTTNTYQGFLMHEGTKETILKILKEI